MKTDAISRKIGLINYSRGLICSFLNFRLFTVTLVLPTCNIQTMCPVSSNDHIHCVFMQPNSQYNCSHLHNFLFLLLDVELVCNLITLHKCSHLTSSHYQNVADKIIISWTLRLAKQRKTQVNNSSCAVRLATLTLKVCYYREN